MTVLKRQAKTKSRRTFRVRNKVRRSARGRARLSVHRTNKHIYAQIIDDTEGKTLVSASSLDGSVAGVGNYAGNKEAAAKVGALIAERALEAGIKQVVLDRGSLRYHGRVAALADAAREKGLDF